MADTLETVCSRNYNDTAHFIWPAGGTKTACGRDASDWPRLDPMTRDALRDSAYTCARCRAFLTDQ